MHIGNNLLGVQVAELLPIVGHAFEGTEVEAKATITSGTSPLYECHTLTLFVTGAATEGAEGLACVEHCELEGSHIVEVDGHCSGDIVRENVVVEGADPLGKLLGSGAVGTVVGDPVGRGSSDDAFFGGGESLSGGEHCVRN